MNLGPKRKTAFLGLLATTLLLASAFTVRAADKDGWIDLFNGRNLDGWMLRHADGRNSWSVKDGILTNAGGGTDIVNIRKFGDQEVHVEYRVPKGSNSGVYLQSRYEVQVDDAYGRDPESHINGAIYDKIAPRVNASKPAGEWQTFDITFHQPRLNREGKVVKKSRVTVILNGVNIIDNKEFDGLTGLTLEDQEGVPGGIMLQGDHGAVEYRVVRARPLKEGGSRDWTD